MARSITFHNGLVLLSEVVQTSQAVGAQRARLVKIQRLTECLRRAAPDEIGVAVAFLSGELRQRQIGVGWASLREHAAPSAEASLTLGEVDAAFEAIGRLAGPGSQGERRRLLDAVFSRATEDEQTFLVRLLTGELRQGALAGLMVEAVARAAEVPADEVRRALMLRGVLGPVAEAALARGVEGLRSFRLEVGRALQPMLAQTAESVGEAFQRVRPAAVEWKLDGARVQVHRSGGEVRVFTRSLDDITARVPEVVEAALALSVTSAVLDGEVLALRPDGRPRPFQETAGRVGSRTDVGGQRRAVPLTPFLFDVLHLDGEDVLFRPGEERFAALETVVPEAHRVPRIVTADAAEAEAFLDDATGRGHEGVMVKSLDAPYEAGRRGTGWLKVKPVHTFDLVVLAAEWGHGRRSGLLSNLHLGARDEQRGGFAMLGKTFKGMTDELLEWQTGRLQELEVAREGITVHVRPELVVEIAVDGVQRSSRYPAGLALRFARVLRYRPDKRADEADTVAAVRALQG